MDEIPLATGYELDKIAEKYGLVRKIETDDELRNRILVKIHEELKLIVFEGADSKQYEILIKEIVK